MSTGERRHSSTRITAEVEVIANQRVIEAYDRLLRSDVRYRFCIDMPSLEQE